MSVLGVLGLETRQIWESMKVGNENELGTKGSVDCVEWSTFSM